MLFHRGGGRAALALAPLILITSCSTEAAEPAIVPIPVVKVLADVPERPIDHYLPSATELLAIEREFTGELNACLSAAGQSGRVEDTKSLEPFIAELIRDRSARSGLYGFFSDQPPANGYAHSGPGTYEAAYPKDVANPVMRLCATEVDKHMTGLSVAMEDKLLPSGGPPIPVGDSRMIAATKKWSACMAEVGQTYTSPLDALTDARWREEAAPSEGQKEVAKSDVKCKQETNLVGTAVAIQAAYDGVYIETHREALTSISYAPPR